MPQGSQLTQDIERARRAIILALFLGLVAFILFSALRGEAFWNKIKGEGNLWNYGSSLLYFLAGELALANALLIRYHDRLAGDARSARSWLAWVAVGVAFTFFACDEMLQVHEKLGLAIEGSVPLLHRMFPGHVDGLITAAYALGGVLFSVGFLRGKTINSVARKYYFAGLLMIAGAQLLDFLPRDWYIGYLPFRETEELLEVFAGWGFAGAFLSTASFAVTRILNLHLRVIETQ